MRVALFPCDLDASGCLRALFPGRELRPLGHEAAMMPYSVGAQQEDGSETIEWDISQIPDADVYLLSRRPEAIWEKLIPHLQSLGKVVIADTDDWYLGTPSYNPAAWGARPYKHGYRIDENYETGLRITAVARKRRFATSENIHTTFKLADALTVSTPFLARSYSRFNRNVYVLPNYLDWEMWRQVKPQYEVEREKVRVGWMGNIRWREGDLRVLAGLIGPWLKRNPHVEFVSAGENLNEDGSLVHDAHDFLGIPEEQRVTYQRSCFVRRDGNESRPELRHITATMDIGLVPLQRNNFNEAKSALKGMEYAACGIPCIATPTESYQDWVDEGVNGFLAQRPKDWIRNLDLLVNDDKRRREMGRNAKAKVQEHTIQKNAWRWEQLYERLLLETSMRAA